MRKLALVLFAATCAIACSNPEKLGTAPSGPGQNTMARSQSVVIASDQATTSNPLFVSPTAPTKVTAVTKSDSTDTSGYCQRGIFVGVQDGGSAAFNNVAVVGLAQDAGVTLTSVLGNTFIPGSFSRIMSTNTTATNIVCLGY